LFSGCDPPGDVLRMSRTDSILSSSLVLYCLLSPSFCLLLYYDPSLTQTIICARKEFSVLKSTTGNCILVTKKHRNSIALCMARRDLNSRMRVFAGHINHRTITGVANQRILYCVLS
jgi:hypothetical protein